MSQPPTRPGRALVLGCTGHLGSRVTQSLLARGWHVVGLVHGHRPESDFFRRRLHDRVSVVRGPIEDADRLASLIAVHEIDAVFQCAAVPEPLPATHALTHRVLSAVAAANPAAAVVVPLAADAPAPSFRNTAGLRVAFVRLVELSAEALADAAVAVAALDAAPPAGLWIDPPPAARRAAA